MAGGGGGGGGAVAGSFAEAYGNARANNFLILTCCVVMMGAAMFGADQQNFGLYSASKSFYDEFCPQFKFTTMTCDEIHDLKDPADAPAEWQNFITYGANFIPFGMAAGALLLSPPLARYLGRRPTICIGGLLTLAGCIVASTLANQYIYLAGRFVTGFGCGIACYVLPMYMNEVAPTNIRGTLGSVFQVLIVIGQLVVTFVYGVVKNYKVGFLMPGMFGIAVAILVWFFPESPKYLIERKGKEAGRAALQQLRSTDCGAELDAIEECMNRAKKVGQVPWLSLFKTPGLRTRVFVACWLQIAQQLTGVNAFLAFQSDIFKSAGLAPEAISRLPFGATMDLMWLFIIGIAVGLSLVDSKHGGRRFQLISASVLMGATLVIASIVKFMALESAGTIVVVCVCLFGFGFQYAWGIIPWFYPAELFQPSEVEKGLALSTFCNFAANFVVLFITKKIQTSWGDAGMYLFFGCLNVLNILFVLVFVKETKGVPADEIPALFGHVEKDEKLIAGQAA